MRRNVLINCSNLHVGGGVQVAASFLYEAARQRVISDDIDVIASSEVDGALLSIGCINKYSFYKVNDVYGLNYMRTDLDRTLDAHRTVFTMFGPLYRLHAPFKSVVGFAQPWIIYPNNECYAKLSIVQRMKTRLKFKIQAFFFKRADQFVVELEHVKQGLINELGISPDRIHVVRNCVSSVFLDKTLWQSFAVPADNGCLRLGFIGRNYIHKNTEIFQGIAEILEKTYGIKACFYVTFTKEEWDDCSAEFRGICINLGPVAVTQCPAFYQSLDAVVFPSLLECFSATPLEAMVMEKPLFASDRPFNRDICGDHAFYFDPLSPESAANAIAQVFLNGGPNKEALRAAREHAINFSNPRERAQKYHALLSQCTEKTVFKR